MRINRRGARGQPYLMELKIETFGVMLLGILVLMANWVPVRVF
jgi:hypothetical protein